ncbi:copper resistance protein CopC [Nocardioides sp. TRM66260-LWL]|uniref:copper resistance CopC family protein n=1 Tax=Nocardioides sp. TRM66260-LWL TaxID=2874478 RepID=UPI001CC73BFB|nr:copper resistance CopC family protein [Nocardioides sp. TRM66260-LWL]MBZ5735926.1 copper resistance protein CopC [Nocardioides sp. TRM66260-LWL]
MTRPLRSAAPAAFPRLAAGLLLAASALLGAGAPALAHAALVSSDPADGATLDAAPRQVTFTFSEAMSEPAYVVVRAADGTSVTQGAPRVENAVVVQSLRADLAPGRYTMAYRAVSADGHPVSDQLSFTVAGSPSSSSSPSSPGTSSSPSSTPVTPAPVAQSADGGTPWPAYASGAATLVVLGGGVVLLLRRRGGSRP